MNMQSRAFAATLAASALLSSTAALAAPQPAACQYIEMAKLPLRYSGPSLMITTEGRINGRPAEMLVDTGAYRNFLTRTGTERFGLQLTTTGQETYGIGGKTQVYKTRVDEFVAGPARAAKGYLPVLADFGFTPTFDAILGAPFLMQADVEISLATKELKFFYPKNCENTFLAYWDASAVVVPFANSHRRDKTNPEFTVVVNGKKLNAMIDTGAGTTSISLEAARRIGLTLESPELVRAGVTAGAGKKKIAQWHAVLRSFEIGAETIDNPDVAVIDMDLDSSDIDVLLGADFLRTHRVLFAMSQQKIYFSYIGGQPFDQRRRIGPWIQAEADAGNADAQMMLSTAYRTGAKVPKNAALAEEWMEKAVRGGSGHANIASGRSLLLAGQVAEGAARLRVGLDKLPSDRSAPLWLYLARLRSGEAELAGRELAAALARNEDIEWPGPVGEFYLGRIDAQALLKQAQDGGAQAGTRRCEALAAMAEWHRARGESAPTAAATTQSGSCTAPAGGD